MKSRGEKNLMDARKLREEIKQEVLRNYKTLLKMQGFIFKKIRDLFFIKLHQILK